MKYKTFLSSSILLVTAAALAAQSNASAAWIGVWHGELEGQPSVTLTMAEDTRELGVTVVLSMFKDDNGTPRLIASVPHVLIHPHLEGNALSFQVKRNSASSELLSFSVALGSAGKAQLRCLSCGPNGDGPVVELVKAQ